MSARALVLAGSALVLPLGIPGCAPRPESSGRGQVLLLLTIDTLRADRVGAGGDPSARTPRLDRLARGGIQCAVAVSPVPLTLPSHATILSGRVPPEHGARDNGLYRVPDDVPLLAEAFRTAGWRTAAFLAAYPLAARFGLARGFDVYRDAPGLRREGSASSFAERSADRVNDEVIAWLEEASPGGPLFLWVHYFDPHAPYVPPRMDARSAGGDAYRGEVQFADREAGRLLRELEIRFDRVRVCCTADHGESLGEHGEATHGVFVYEATTRVPLMFHGPEAPPHIVSRPVSLASVAPTVAAWAGLGDAAAPLGTPCLFAPGSETREGSTDPIYVESMYPRLRHGWAALRGLRTETWKVIRAPEPEIYDLARDPREKRNLYGDAGIRREVAELFARLEDPRWEESAPAPTPDPEVEAALRSLGYAGAQGPSADDEPRPDPKARIRLEKWLGRAAGALEGGSLDAARRAIAAALSIDPRNKETLVLRARLEAASGAYEEAFALFDYCLGLPPASADALVHYERGRVALDAGLLERAESSFASSVAADPLNVDARFNWGVAAYRAGRFDDAAERWRETLRLDPGHPGARRWLPDARAREGAGS